MKNARSIAETPNLRIVERVLYNRAGQLVRAIFLIGYVNGAPHIRLISAERIYTLAGTTASPSAPLLCGECQLRAKGTEEDIPQPILSPYVSSVDAIFVSQMTRAPSLAATR